MADDEILVAQKDKKTISLTKFLVIIIVILLTAIGIFAYLRYRALGDTPFGNLGYRFTQKPRFLFNIYGAPKHMLKSPMAVFVDENRMIYVANTEGHSVEVYKPDGQYAYSFGGFGTGLGQMSYPYGITQDGSGNILVSESGNGRIQVFSKEGRFLRVLLNKTSLTGLKKPGPLFRDPKGNIYISDLNSQKVIVINDAGKELGILTGFQYPHGIAVDKNNRVYVSDSGNNQVIVFDDKGKKINYISKWQTDRPFSMVRGVAVSPDGEIFIADTVASQIRVFNSKYKYMFSLGSQGMENGNFVFPAGIFIDSRGKIYIADWGNNRIQVWGY